LIISVAYQNSIGGLGFESESLYSNLNAKAIHTGIAVSGAKRDLHPAV